MDRRAAWVIGIIFGGLVVCLFGFLVVLSMALGSGRRSGVSSADHVGVIEVVGEIRDSKLLLKEIRDFSEDDHVKAVVVRIDSPGGAVGPSQEIYDAIRKLSKKKKVVASMGSIAASGGFYIACAAEKVYANPGTLTGSIGVIFAIPNFRGLMKWAGVEMNTITAGRMKDSGSPYREMTPEERAYFERVLHDVHEQFIEAVADGRKLKADDVRPNADGRVFTGRQAKELKLVDELGGFDDAAEAAAKMAGIKDDPPELEYPKKDKKLLEELLGEDARSVVGGAASSVMEGLTGGMGLQYRMPIVEGQ
ncbi:MAG TPA: signal peptide peptidase SppA [Myxococcaceae bacterium]|nr:signal peptide peptidase SppA [Myxococcaceae bacterium]